MGRPALTAGPWQGQVDGGGVCEGDGDRTHAVDPGVSNVMTSRSPAHLPQPLPDARSGRVVFLSHCLLNQNTVTSAVQHAPAS